MKQLLLILAFCCSLATYAQVNTGTQAPDFTLKDLNNTAVKLSDFRGKVVLVDFWASWCGPCRRSNPKMVRLYEKFKDRGLIIIGVSIDEKKASWKAAVKKDQLPYIQLNDPAGWQSPTAEKYGVEAIPATFLIDAKGIIRAIDAEGTELEQKISELL